MRSCSYLAETTNQNEPIDNGNFKIHNLPFFSTLTGLLICLRLFVQYKKNCEPLSLLEEHKRFKKKEQKQEGMGRNNFWYFFKTFHVRTWTPWLTC